MLLSLNRVQADGSHVNFGFYLVNLGAGLSGNSGHPLVYTGVSQPWDY